MDIQQSVKTVLSNYVNFEGRSGREEFWWFVLAYFIGGLVINLAGGIVGLGGPLSTIYQLALLLPSLAVSIRRMHDTGRSGWWVLIAFIPILGWIAYIYFAAQPSASANQYGEGPQPPVA